MSSKVNIMIAATKQLNETVESDIYIPIRTSEYKDLVTQVETYKAKFEAVRAQYWDAQRELREIKEFAGIVGGKGSE